LSTDSPVARRRRRLHGLIAFCVVGIGVAAGLLYEFLPPSSPTDIRAEQLMAQLMVRGPLPDIVQGSAKATVTIIEYASMTCTHCYAFHAGTWPALKAKYVDTGKVKFIIREYPLDPLAAAAFMLARCAGPDKRTGVVDFLFDRQKSWAFVDKPLEALATVFKQGGKSQTEFETCLKDQDLYNKIVQTREEASKKFNITSTPTFFVNGRQMSGELPIEEFDKVLGPLLR
jgi:protein-disulfide isomerase